MGSVQAALAMNSKGPHSLEQARSPRGLHEAAPCLSRLPTALLRSGEDAAGATPHPYGESPLISAWCSCWISLRILGRAWMLQRQEFRHQTEPPSSELYSFPYLLQVPSLEYRTLLPSLLGDEAFG